MAYSMDYDIMGYFLGVLSVLIVLITKKIREE